MRHGHKHGGGGPMGVQLGMIITPFLDMSFQLLAFFIMTYHPSALEGHIDGNLLPPTLLATKGPKSAENMPSELPPIDEEPPLQDVLLVVVKSADKTQNIQGRADGEPSQILLKKPESADRVTIADTDVTLAQGLKKLTAELKKVLDEPGASKTNIKIEADGTLKHRYLMQVYDACKIAGYQNISFVAPARERTN